MDISRFMIILIILTVGFLFVEKEKIKTIIDKKEKPTVTFQDSTMYDITEERVEQIVKSKVADIYKNRELLKDAVIVVKSEKNNIETNIISGKDILKKDDDIFVSGNVNLQLSNGLEIRTEYLDYNTKNKIARNNVDFIALKESDYFTGNSLYLDTVNEHIIAKKTKFKMKVTDE